MNLKLSELTEDITVVSETKEDFATVQNILTINNVELICETKDAFETHPFTNVHAATEKNTMWYINQSIYTNAYVKVSASKFIAANI